MYAKVNGTRIFFDVAGKQFVPDGPVMREKPVCLVLHGGPGSDHSHFLPGILPLAEHMQLIFLDHRNSGRSEWGPIETSSMKQNSEDAEAVRQYLGLDKIYVLGQSYGGMVAQQYALDHQAHLHGIRSGPYHYRSQLQDQRDCHSDHHGARHRGTEGAVA